MRYFTCSFLWYLSKNLLKNAAMFLMPGTINRLRGTTGTGNRHIDHNIDKLAEYAHGVFEKYQRWIAAADPCISMHNKTIVELGPGDTIATALLFLAHGATRIVCVDRFKLVVNSKKNTLLAHRILGMLPEQQRQQLQDMLTFNSHAQVRWDAKRLDYLRIRNETIPLPDASADIIVSNAVLEHVQNLDVLFAHMRRVLKPGGIMVHAADLKSHNLHHTTSLDYLAVPETLWKCMTFHRGAPNRKRIADYKTLLHRHGFEVTAFKVTSRVPQEDISAFTQTYPDQARKFSSENLSCGGFIFTAKKPHSCVASS